MAGASAGAAPPRMGVPTAAYGRMARCTLLVSALASSAPEDASR